MHPFEENPDSVSQADIIIGIPSYKEADSIAYTASEAGTGLSKFFGGKSAVIINCDNNSPDGTREAFLNASTDIPKIYISTPEGVLGKGANLRNLFTKAVELEAKAVIVLDADLQSITPQWIRNLGDPLFDEHKFDYVTPLYVRHKYDGALTNSIVYPLTRCLYGRRIRQPIGGDFAFSGELAKVYASEDNWTDAVSEFGIDVWMTTIAMRRNSPVIQSFMGRPKIHRAKMQGTDPGPMFAQIVGTAFDLMIEYADFWKGVKWSRPTAVFGFGLGELEIPPEVTVDLDGLWESFCNGMAAGADTYAHILMPETLDKLREVAELPMSAFEFPTALWAKVLYDFACAYRLETAQRADILKSLIPLYHGKRLSFVIETEPMNTQQVEEVLEDQCLQFEKTKPYLLERWFSK